MPDKVGAEIIKSEQLDEMPNFVFQKAISDLIRFGFVRYYHSSGTFGGGFDVWDTTEYLIKFKETFKSQ